MEKHKDKMTRIDPKHVGAGPPELQYATDERLMSLMEAALKGEIPVYHGMVPLGICVPFDVNYRPDGHQALVRITEKVLADAKQGIFAKILV